jgi:hypothetical protein
MADGRVAEQACRLDVTRFDHNGEVFESGFDSTERTRST